MREALLYSSEEALYGQGPPSPPLSPFRPLMSPVSETFSAPSPPPSPPPTAADTSRYVPDNEGLLRSFAPNYPELHTAYLPPALPSSVRPAMTGHGEGVNPRTLPGAGTAIRVAPENQAAALLDRKDLAEKATAGLLEHEAASRSSEKVDQHDTEGRHDSAQDKVPQLTPQQKEHLSGRRSPALTLQTTQVLPRREPPVETITSSPKLSRHIISTANAVTTLPAFHTISPVRDGSVSSPQGEKLPSLQQVVAGQLAPLDELAEVATQQASSAGSRQHSQSFGSPSAPSPFPPYPYSTHPQSAASPYFVHSSGRSPTSTISDHMYKSLSQFPGVAYYTDRRSSAPNGHPPHLPPSLPSASSSADSYGATNSSTDGYSTAQTTPNELSESTPRPFLPPPPGMQSSAVLQGGSAFRCDHPGCNSIPFQTQYLLSSHKTVHSQIRNHYCPVDGCPRSEGGRGFKRKNEMIRHGLVHDSPGYVCPFCPDKEHRYPRPDNLQRHVRVHHVDKDKDDPLLRDVLAQRREGIGKTRRRRAGTGASV